MAQVLIRKRDFSGARDLLTGALDHSPEDGLCKAYLAWALWLDPDLLQDAVTPRVMELLQSAVKIVPDEAEPHFFLGSLRRHFAADELPFIVTVNTCSSTRAGRPASDSPAQRHLARKWGPI